MFDFKAFLLAFIPIFVAVDALGVLPIFISLTEHVKKPIRGGIIRDSVITGTTIAIIFIFVGKSIFSFLGITMYDFMVAGGILLFILAINDLLRSDKVTRMPEQTVGVVPLGMPLIVGPAVLTTSLMMMDNYGIPYTLISVVLNILIAGAIFACAEVIMKLIGKGGTKAISKVASLFLAAIAIMMIRKGITHICLDFLK